MSDEFLSQLREDPRPEFASVLRQRLRTQEAKTGTARHPLLGGRWRPALTAVCGLALLGLLLSFPTVRVAAQGFLDMFRIKRFAAVPFDPERLARLQGGQVDLKTLLGGQVEVLQDPGQPQVVEDVEAAAAMIGLDVKVPTVVPNGMSGPEVRVGGKGLARVTIDVAKIEALLEALDVEAEAPRDFDGTTVTIETPQHVLLRYKRGDEEIVFAQARSPEVALPPGLDLARLGEVGLQVAGLSPEEARSFARTIDWRTTLLIAVPAEQATYREVEVRGAKGLLVTSVRRPRPAAEGQRRFSRRHSVLLWSEADMIFALAGRGSGTDLIEMAQSIR